MLSPSPHLPLGPKRERTLAELKHRAVAKKSFNRDHTITAQKAIKIGKVVEKKVTDAKVNYSKSMTVPPLAL